MSEVDEEPQFDEGDADEPPCHDCGGEGVVESVVEYSGRWGWDDDKPGPCPNCRGSGKRKDCTTF